MFHMHCQYPFVCVIFPNFVQVNRVLVYREFLVCLYCDLLVLVKVAQRDVTLLGLVILHIVLMNYSVMFCLIKFSDQC